MCAACMEGRCSQHGRPVVGGIPVIESTAIARDKIVHSKAGAFLDAPWRAAMIMHPVTAMTLYVATERGLPTTDMEVRFEAVRRHLARQIDKSASVALYRLNQLCRDIEQRHEPDDADG